MVVTATPIPIPKILQSSLQIPQRQVQPSAFGAELGASISGAIQTFAKAKTKKASQIVSTFNVHHTSGGVTKVGEQSVVNATDPTGNWLIGVNEKSEVVSKKQVNGLTDDETTALDKNTKEVEFASGIIASNVPDKEKITAINQTIRGIANSGYAGTLGNKALLESLKEQKRIIRARQAMEVATEVEKAKDLREFQQTQQEGVRKEQAEIRKGKREALAKKPTLSEIKAEVLNKFLTKGAKNLSDEENAVIEKELSSGRIRLVVDPETGAVTFTQGAIGGASDTFTTSTPTVKSKAISSLDTVDDTLGLISDYTELLTSSAQVGAVGRSRKLLQGLGEQITGVRDSILTDIEATDSELALIDMFDETLPKLTLLGNEMAYAMARSREPGGRLSVDDVNNAKKSLQIEKLLTGEKTIRASLESFSKILKRKRGIAARRVFGKKAFEIRFQQLTDSGLSKKEAFNRLKEEGF